jgi:predicted secreted protein
MTKEVIELSRQPLDAALFDVPAGYAQANSMQEMYAAPSVSDMMSMGGQQGANQGRPSNPPSSMSNPTAARAKVGVVEFNNKAKASVSTDELRQQLIATLNGDGIEAVALNASSASEAAMEAKAKGCTYILYTDISTFKAPSTGKKVGGFLGRATGVGGGGGDVGKAEAKFDFRLVPAGSSSAKLQSSASGKEETTEASVNAALQEEARAVVGTLGN